MDHFPVEIKQVAGRGRGFFATQDIPYRHPLFLASPLAWTINQDFAKNVCHWCFHFNDRKKQPINMMNSAAASHYRGVFCSLDCQAQAIQAHGGQDKWSQYLDLLAAIDSGAGTKRKHNKKKEKKEKKTPVVQEVAVADDNLATFANNKAPKLLELTEQSTEWAEFDPHQISDPLLAQWITQVWDSIHRHRLFDDYQLDGAEKEKCRLVATQLCLDQPGGWEPQMAGSQEIARLPVAPRGALRHMKPNELESFRHQLAAVMAADDDEVSSADTLVPLRIPWLPTPSQITESRWGRVFEAAAGTYQHLSRSWHSRLGSLDHQGFRDIYYRELANSFGIWDPSDYADNSDGNGYVEQEYLGCCVYPTAVYFNHSCWPNVAKHRHGRAMQFTSNREIKRGEELFISYGSIADSLDERRERLRDHFFFTCSCDRCLREEKKNNKYTRN